MNDCHIVKQVCNELSRLHELGFTTWYIRAWQLVRQYDIDLFNNDGDFKTYCKSFIENKFTENWELDVQNIKIPSSVLMQRLKQLLASKNTLSW